MFSNVDESKPCLFPDCSTFYYSIDVTKGKTNHIFMCGICYAIHCHAGNENRAHIRTIKLIEYLVFFHVRFQFEFEFEQLINWHSKCKLNLLFWVSSVSLLLEFEPFQQNKYILFVLDSWNQITTYEPIQFQYCQMHLNTCCFRSLLLFRSVDRLIYSVFLKFINN